MSFALTFTTVVYVLLCVFMIFVILLQPGKDAGMGSALGGGASSSAFGGRGAVTLLSKLTGICAALFFLTALGLSFAGLQSSVAEDGPAPSVVAPAVPGTPTVEQPATDAPPTGTAPAAPAGETPPIEGGGNPANPAP